MNLLKISFSILLLSLTSFVFWLEAPQNIVLEKATDSSLELSWDKVEWAEVYAISYWTVSWSGWVYENELEWLWTESWTWIIEDLKANTNYYIAIKAYDSNNNESEYSNEVEFSTLENIGNLKIDWLEIIDSRNIKLLFNYNLNSDKLVNLNIINNDNNLENIEVENYKIIDNSLNIFLNSDLTINNKYSVTVVTIEWINWELIENWVDWIKEFTVPTDTVIYSEESNNVDLNSAWTWADEEWSNKVLGWKDLNTSEKNTEIVAKDKKDLPTTWPTETILFLFFSLIAWFLFLNLRRKVN